MPYVERMSNARAELVEEIAYLAFLLVKIQSGLVEIQEKLLKQQGGPAQ